MRQHIGWAIALVLFGGATVRGEDQLAWKFKEGDKFYTQHVSRTKQTVEVMGQTQKQTLDLTMVDRYTVKKKTAAGTVLEAETIAVRASGEGGLEEAAKIMEKMKGSVFTLTLGPDNRVQKVEGYDALVKKIAADDEKAAKMFKLMFSEKTMRKGAEEIFAFLPAKPIAKGAKWDRTHLIPLGPIGDLKAKDQYTYQGKDKEGARISVVGELSFVAPEKEVKDSPIQLTKGTLKESTYKGTILFNPERGRLERYVIKMDAKMALTGKVQAVTLEMDLSMETKTTIRVLDKPPADN